MKHSLLHGCAAVLAIAFGAHATAGESSQQLTIPDVKSGTPRAITVEDLSALRRIDALSLSPDRTKFAVLVRQADAAANVYRRAWFVGSTRGGPLTPIGDGGEARLAPGGKTYTGDIFEQPALRWSPDGQQLAYTLRRNGQTQLWWSKTDGGAQEQLTHNVADVHELEWSADGKSIQFTVGTPRAEINGKAEAKEREGYRYDDLFLTTEFMTLRPERDGALDKVRTPWTYDLTERRERLAEEVERNAFEEAHRRHSDGTLSQLPAVGAPLALAVRTDGARAWSARTDAKSFMFRMQAQLSGSTAPIECKADECAGVIMQTWWRGDSVIFLRPEGDRGGEAAFYSWTPATGAVSLIKRFADDFLQHCNQDARGELLCAVNSPWRPSHIATIDLKSGALRMLVDFNPEFRNIGLGKIERFKWATPKFAWNEPGGRLAGMYAHESSGYILYPPDFDSKRKYPVFISPYSAAGFDNGSNQEYALHVLAAHGFVVLSTNFPSHQLDIATRLGPDYMKVLYSAELGFPHLAMFTDSTMKALDAAEARGFVDRSRIAMGGLSHGAFISWWTLRKYDRLAAVAVSGATWDPTQYYAFAPGSRSGRSAATLWPPTPVGDEAQKYWNQLDLAAHVDTIEAPVLLNVAAHEMYGVVRLMRHMEEARKPYDAYVFDQETHVKWQPAHLYAIMRRNVDWFRFWLQSYEDPDPSKAQQYVYWRRLREMHEANRKSAPASP
jgi:dipeptidyl aminopeptidase/acylaminoacyl peptidase